MARKAQVAEKPKHWTPRLAVIRQRNRDFLSHSLEAAKDGKIVPMTSHVMLEQQALLKYIDLLHARLLENGIDLPKGVFADVTAKMDLEPEHKPEAEPSDDEPAGTDPDDE